MSNRGFMNPSVVCVHSFEKSDDFPCIATYAENNISCLLCMLCFVAVVPDIPQTITCQSKLKGAEVRFNLMRMEPFFNNISHRRRFGNVKDTSQAAP